MVSRTLKKLGNSRCLPLDKTLLEILGIKDELVQINIVIDNNRLILEKAVEFQEKTTFSLNDEQWEEFNKALDAKPKDLSNLHKLLNESSVFDE